MADLPEHARRNRDEWNGFAADYVATAERNWAAEEPTWGIWDVAESQVRMLPAELGGKDAIELGCGAGYVSAWLARRGANVTGIDISSAQLATARRLRDRYELEIEFMEGSAEDVPLPDASFDLAISEYGASAWCDPYAWIPEAARLLRPGGELAYYQSAPLVMLCARDDEEDPAARAELLRDYFGLRRLEWSDDNTVGFHLPHGETLRLLRDSGFEVLELQEIQPPEGATTRYDWVPLEWARRWPCEELWRARKR